MEQLSHSTGTTKKNWVDKSTCEECGYSLFLLGTFNLGWAHHCRLCERCLCHACSSFFIAVPPSFPEPVRVCKACRDNINDTVPLLCVPSEALLLIMKYVRRPTDLFHLAQSCRTLYRLSQGPDFKNTRQLFAAYLKARDDDARLKSGKNVRAGRSNSRFESTFQSTIPFDMRWNAARELCERTPDLVPVIIEGDFVSIKQNRCLVPRRNTFTALMKSWRNSNSNVPNTTMLFLPHVARFRECW